MHMGNGIWDWSWQGLMDCLNSRTTVDGVVKYVGINAQGQAAYFDTEAALDAVQFTQGYLSVHEQSQTFAFTVLAMSQIFHMVGMTDLKRSFIHVFKDGNWMLLIAFVLGFALQIGVTEIHGLALVFGTTALAWNEWLILAAMASVPLIVHEILAPIFRKTKSQLI
jgi:Ca2+-transporting ATPase